jgi:hypothetical protein
VAGFDGVAGVGLGVGLGVGVGLVGEAGAFPSPPLQPAMKIDVTTNPHRAARRTRERTLT